MHKIKQTFQQDSTDCGPACIKMILFYYGKNIHLDDIREICYLSRDGVSFLSISEALVRFGFKTFGNKLSLFELKKENLLPCILHWNQNHFVVLHKIRKKKFTGKYVFQIADPAHGILTLNENSFEKSWQNEDGKGIALFVEPTQKFYENTESANDTVDFSFLFRFLKPYKKEVFLLF